MAFDIELSSNVQWRTRVDLDNSHFRADGHVARNNRVPCTRDLSRSPGDRGLPDQLPGLNLHDEEDMELQDWKRLTLV